MKSCGEVRSSVAALLMGLGCHRAAAGSSLSPSRYSRSEALLALAVRELWLDVSRQAAGTDGMAEARFRVL